MTTPRLRTPLLAILTLAAAVAAQDDPLVGSWQGTLELGAQKLEVALHVTRGETGYGATLDSITQGAEGIPVAAITIQGDHVVAEVDAIGGHFEADLVREAPRRLAGTWSQNGVALPLTLTAVQKVSKPARPQEPQPPFPYRTEEIAFGHDPAHSVAESFRGGPGEGVTLAGTLTVPEGDGRHPAAVMITGSGRQDRDETVMGHKPFWVLADHLTRAGLAVLRFDDRGVGASTGSFDDATSADFADDVHAALRFLMTRDDIDATRLGLIGHSEGGLIAPMVATGPAADVAFAVLLAPPAVTLAEVIAHQSRQIAATDGADEADVAANDELMRAVFAAVTEVEDADERRAAIQAAAEATWSKLSATARASVGQGPADLARAAGRLDTPWARFLLDYDPTAALRAMRCDVLALFGAKDLQVDPAQNLAPLRTALEAGASRTTIEVLDGHNHLFQRAETGSPSEYATIEETFSPRALETVRGWIAARVLAKR